MSVQSESTTYYPGIVIVLSSPNPTRFKEFLKSPYSLLLYMKKRGNNKEGNVDVKIPIKTT